MDLALSGNKLFSLVSLASKHCWDMWRAGGDCNPSRDGALYIGHKSVTVNGKQCQAWMSQSPHQHSYNQDGLFPDKSVNDASNYCRNPDHWNGGLWCFTTDPKTEWEKCYVPTCGRSLRCIK